MSALALPKRYSIPPNTKANPLAARIGVKFNGEIRPLDVVAYDVEKGVIKLLNGEILYGTVEPYWRTDETWADEHRKCEA